MNLLARLVASQLEKAGFTEVLTTRPAAWAHPEPIVVVLAGFGCESRQANEERGLATLEVRVVREDAAAALEDACGVERALRGMDRSALSHPGLRASGIDTRAPVSEGSDGSGRAVMRVDCPITIARTI